MSHALDRPIWNALMTHHAAFAHGGKRARCYLPDFVPLAATLDNSKASFSELRDLLPAAGVAAIATPDPIITPAGLAIVMTAKLDQMTATSIDQALGSPALISLEAPDVQEMSDLAKMLHPGAFASRSHALGRYLGVRADGRLVAMAGERLRLPGFIEISSVCTNPDYRGRGYASALIARISQGVL
jgi:predicted GNAT family acetyltransferase